MSEKNKKSGYRGDERRKSKRTEVQEYFSLSIVIPNKLGMVRIYMRDLSKSGLCFRTEMDAEFSLGQIIDLRLYINPSFYLPLKSKVMRVHAGEVGLEFVEMNAPATLAVTKLLEFFEAASLVK